MSTSESDKKKQVLKEVLSQIEKQFGEGAIMSLGSYSLSNAVQVISTESLSLDIALGIGGIPRGRIIEIYGPESSGKSTLALHAVANCQKNGGIAAYIDAEHALDPSYARKIGVQIDDLFISQPDNGEEALNIVEMLVRSNTIDIIVIDSVAALVPRCELEGNMGDIHLGLQARLMSQALRKLTSSTSKSNSSVIFINQIREKIGFSFGNPETTTGGRALKFYSSVRIEIKKTNSLKNSDNQEIGIRVKAKIVKNKMAPPFKSGEFDIFFNEGISRTGDIIDLSIEMSLMEKRGTWISFKDQKFQGKENARIELNQHPHLLHEIEQQILEKIEKKSGIKLPSKNSLIKSES